MIILEGFLQQINKDLSPVDKAYNGEEAINKLLINQFPTDLCPNHVPYKYVFISPVFNSISKVGYNAAIDLNELSGLRNTCITARGYCPGIIGLGGVGSRELPSLKSAGFDGAAVLGAVWQAKDPVAETARLLGAAKAL